MSDNGRFPYTVDERGPAKIIVERARQLARGGRDRRGNVDRSPGYLLAGYIGGAH